MVSGGRWMVGRRALVYRAADVRHEDDVVDLIVHRPRGGCGVELDVLDALLHVRRLLGLDGLARPVEGEGRRWRVGGRAAGRQRGRWCGGAGVPMGRWRWDVRVVPM